jgi:pathogenesis-related protein 1
VIVYDTGVRTLILCGLAMAASAAEDGSLARDMLAAHNAVRAKVGVPPLVWSEKLAAAAQEWADTLIAQRRFEHRPNSSHGENLFRLDGGRATPRNVVERWASEQANFNYKSNRCKGECGHYTQIVWRSTKEVGCAVARGGGREVWVCEYAPPGNYVGQRPY